MQQHATMGYHRAGEFHYYSVLKEGNVFLGAGGDEDYRTHDAFAGLVTAVHEHYHLMQDLTQGLFWWRQNTQDLLTSLAVEVMKHLSGKAVTVPMLETPDISIKELVTDSSNLLSFAPMFWLELLNIERYTTDSKLTRHLLNNEIRDSPSLLPFISDEAYNLTAMDLIECQAAILTELYVSKLITEQPTKFDSRVVSDLSSLFRVDQMLPTYRRPLEVLLHIFKAARIDL